MIFNISKQLGHGVNRVVKLALDIIFEIVYNNHLLTTTMTCNFFFFVKSCYSCLKSYKLFLYQEVAAYPMSLWATILVFYLSLYLSNCNISLYKTLVPFFLLGLVINKLEFLFISQTLSL